MDRFGCVEISESLCILILRQEDLYNILKSCCIKETPSLRDDGEPTLPPIAGAADAAITSPKSHDETLNNQSPAAIINISDKFSLKSNPPPERFSKWRQWKASLNSYIPNVRFRRRQTSNRNTETDSALSQTVSFQNQTKNPNSEKLLRVSTEVDLLSHRSNSEAAEKRSLSVPYLNSHRSSFDSPKRDASSILDLTIMLGNKTATTDIFLTRIASFLGYNSETDDFYEKFSFILSGNCSYYNSSMNFSARKNDSALITGHPGAPEEVIITIAPQETENKRVWLLNIDGIIMIGTADCIDASDTTAMSSKLVQLTSEPFSRIDESSSVTGWTSLVKTLLRLKQT